MFLFLNKETAKSRNHIQHWQWQLADGEKRPHIFLAFCKVSTFNFLESWINVFSISKTEVLFTSEISANLECKSIFNGATSKLPAKTIAIFFSMFV